MGTCKDLWGQYIFRFLYICPGLLKKGFLEGCRRVLLLHTCFLRGPWDGQLFFIVGRDTNDHMYYVADYVAGVLHRLRRKGLGDGS